MPSIVAVNPFKCRMWGLHDRLDTHINEETCRAEIESFLRHGQLVPVLGRRLNGDPGHEIELIYGARRLFVARHINKPLLAELRELSDRDALIAMDIENRERVDISPYERGMSYVRWIFEGHFKTQEDLAKGLRVSASQVSRLLKLARMPSVIVAAFENPTEIRESWGLELIDACEDPQRRDRLLREARSIARMRPRLTATEVYRNLQTACACGRRVRSSSHDRVVKDTGGAPLFRIRQHSSSVALVLPREKLSQPAFERIVATVTDILHGATPQFIDHPGENAGATSVQHLLASAVDN